MGYEQVAAGQVISASTMNLALSQGVLRFTNAAQRDSQLPSPPEGQLCWLADINMLQEYQSGWRTVGAYRMGHGNHASQSIPNNTTTLVQFATFGGLANDPGRAVWTVDGKVKVPYSGSYLVTGSINWASNATGQRTLQLRRSADGSTWNRAEVAGGFAETQTPGSGILVQSISGTVYMTANYYLGVFATQNSGASLALASADSLYGRIAVQAMGAD